MLSEYKQLYEQKANQLGKWRNLSKSDLCYLYLQCKDKDKSEMYLAAIVYKVLNRAITYYSKQYFKLLSEEDCYDVIIQSILYVLDKKVWENPSSSLYGSIAI